MADRETQTDGDLAILVHEHTQMIQGLMRQQAESEDTSTWQIRVLQKEVNGLREDLQRYKETTRDLENQLAGKDAYIPALHSRAQQLRDDLRNSSTDVATEVLGQAKKKKDPELDSRFNKLKEDNDQIHKKIDASNRDLEKRQDEVDVLLESLGSRLRQFKDDISHINSHTIAKTIAETDEKGVTKISARLDGLGARVNEVVQTSKKTSSRINELKLDVAVCKNIFASINKITSTKRGNGQNVDDLDSGKRPE